MLSKGLILTKEDKSRELKDVLTSKWVLSGQKKNSKLEW